MCCMTIKEVEIRGLPQAPESPVHPIDSAAIRADASIYSETDGVITEQSSRTTVAQQKALLKVNDAIEAANIASGAVTDIERLFNGIQGIAEQITKGDYNPQRVSVLEKEAQNLRDEIIKAADRSTSSGVKPLAGDTIRVEVEQTIGKALEIIFPDDARDAFGLGDIKFSPKEVIINTITSIERARQGIDELRHKFEEGEGTLKSAVLAIDIAAQNDYASRNNVRDVDAAVTLAYDTKGDIKGNPSEALHSVGDIHQPEELLF